MALNTAELFFIAFSYKAVMIKLSSITRHEKYTDLKARVHDNGLNPVICSNETTPKTDVRQ